jgi:hypothetical protein
MELNNKDAVVRTDSAADAQTDVTSAGELDLYDDLTAFTDLSPEEQWRSLVQPDESAESDIAAAGQAHEKAFSGPVQTEGPIEPVETAMAATETETPSTEEAEEHTLPGDLPAKAVGVETAGGGIETSSAEGDQQYDSPEPVPFNLPIEAARAQAAVAPTDTSSDEEAGETTLADRVLVDLPVEPVGAETSAAETGVQPEEPRAESRTASGALHGYSDSDKIRPQPYDGSRPSGPLSGFILTPDFVFTGALSRGVCLGCGADAGVDDLFCMACGAFIDEIASTLRFNPTCTECKQGITAGEIFCPWCGSPLPG